MEGLTPVRGAFIVALVLLLSALSFLPSSAALPPAQGDWIVAGPELVANRTVVVNGSLIVTETGQLALHNVTLLINSAFDGEHSLRVNASGSLNVDGGRIAALDSARTFRFEVLGNASLRGTIVEYLWGGPGLGFHGGVQVLGGSLSLEGTTIRYSKTNGVHVMNGRLSAQHVIIHDTPFFGIYLNRTAGAIVNGSLLYDYNLASGGVFAEDSPDIQLTNTTIRGYSGVDGFLGWHADGLRIEGCSFENRGRANSISVHASRNVTIRDTGLKNLTRPSGITLSEGSSGGLYNVTAPYNGYLEVFESNAIATQSHLAGGISVEDGGLLIDDSAVAETVDLTRATYEAANITHDRGTGVLFWIVNGSKAVLTNYTADFSFMGVDQEASQYNASDPSEIVVRNYLDLRTLRPAGAAIPGADLRVSSGGVPVYATPAFGGSDAPTDARGRSPTLTLVDRVYHRDVAIPDQKPFENITYLTTQAEAALNGTRFGNSPRDSNMSTSHEEVFVGDATPPTIVSVAATPDPVDLGQPVELRAVAFDDWRVASVLAHVAGPTGAQWDLPMPESQPGLFTARKAFPELGAYAVTVTAADPVGWNATAPTSFRVADLSGPTISNLTVVPGIGGPGQDVRVSATVTDNVAVADVTLAIQGPEGFSNASMRHVGDVYELTWRFTALGTYNMTLWASDAYPHRTHANLTYVVVDSTAPVIMNLTVVPRIVGPGQSARVTASVTDDVGVAGASLHVQGPGADDNLTMGHTGDAYEDVLSYLRLGTYDLTLWAVDTTGHWAHESTAYLVADFTPPVSTLGIGTPRVDHGPLVYIRPDTSLSLSADDGSNGSGVAWILYRWDAEAWMTYLAPFTSPGADGPHSLEYYAVDFANNSEPVRSQALILDGTGPAVAWSIGTPKVSGTSVFVSPATPIALNATDDVGVASLTLTVDGNAVPYSGPISLPEGSHVLTAHAVDLLGSATDPPALSLASDGTPPSTSLSASPVVGTRPLFVGPDSRFVLGVADGGAGVANIRYAVDGRWATYQGPFVLAGERGYVTLSYSATDRLGNAEDVHVVLVFVDVDSPIAIATADPASPFLGDRVQLNASASTDDGGIASYAWVIAGPSGEIDLDGAEVTFVVNATGRYSVLLLVTDVLGRASNATLVLEVSAVPTLPPAPTPGLGLVAALAVVALAPLVFAILGRVLRRRRIGREPPSG